MPVGVEDGRGAARVVLGALAAAAAAVGPGAGAGTARLLGLIDHGERSAEGSRSTLSAWV